MSATIIAATTAAVAVNSAKSANSPAPAIWLMVMMVFVLVWAVWLFCDPRTLRSERSVVVSLGLMGVIGIVLALAISALVG